MKTSDSLCARWYGMSENLHRGGLGTQTGRSKNIKVALSPFPLSSLWVTGPGRPMWWSPKRHNGQSAYAFAFFIFDIVTFSIKHIAYFIKLYVIMWVSIQCWVILVREGYTQSSGTTECYNFNLFCSSLTLLKTKQW